jgi:putative SOS response-associated peptidase YedK
MPVILSPEHEQAWLDTSTSRDDLHDLLGGLSASEVAMRPVGLAVNDARYDGPECLTPPVDSGQEALF